MPSLASNPSVLVGNQAARSLNGKSIDRQNALGAFILQSARGHRGCQQRHLNSGRLRAHAFGDPSELVQDALVALRKADTQTLRKQLAPGLLQYGNAEQQVLLVGGQPIIERGPLSGFTDVLDTGARRLLPGNLLRRCKVLSSLKIGGERFLQRVAVTACTGEEGVLIWDLVRRDESWWVLAIQRDDATDFPPPLSPHPRSSPESVVLAQLELLQRGNVGGAARFHVFAGIPGGTDMSERAMATLLEDDRFLLIMGHDQADLGASALPDNRTFVQEVSISKEPASFQGTGRAPRLPEAARLGARSSGQRVQQSFLWTLGLRDCGSWMVKTVAAVASP